MSLLLLYIFILFRLTGILVIFYPIYSVAEVEFIFEWQTEYNIYIV